MVRGRNLDNIFYRTICGDPSVLKLIYLSWRLEDGVQLSRGSLIGIGLIGTYSNRPHQSARLLHP